MGNDTRGNGERLPDRAGLSARLRRLGERLEHVHRGRASDPIPDRPAGPDPSAIARGFRLSTELVAGVLVGAAIGWLIDRLAGSSPWGMIVFLLLGFAAGVLNVMRAAGVLPGHRLDPPPS
jgi:ATP synthase protein I